MTNTDYPECEKLTEHRSKINELLDFISFLNKNGIYFGKHHQSDNNPWLDPVNLEREGETIAAKFYGVDMKKVEEEREKLARTLSKN